MVQIYNTTVLISKYISLKTITNYKALVTFLSKKKEENDSNLSGFWIVCTLWGDIQHGFRILLICIIFGYLITLKWEVLN